MFEETVKIVEENISVFTALIGVIIGAVLNNFVNWKLKTKETKLKIIEKLIDKKINAYEEVLKIVKTLRAMHSTGLADKDLNLIGYPVVLKNKNEFKKFHLDFSSIANDHSHWLDIKIIRELFFIQDYILTLKINLENVDERYYFEIGKIIKQDFVDISKALEDITLNCYQNKISKIKIEKAEGWHKYIKSETLKRMSNTVLIKEKTKIDNFQNKKST